MIHAMPALALSETSAWEAVFTKAQNGCRESMGEMYGAVSPLVVSYLSGRVEDPQGVCNDVFLDVLPKVPKLTGGFPGFRAMLFTVARARAVDCYRAAAKRPEPAAYVPDVDDRTVVSVEETAIARIDSDRTMGLLDRLGEDQREVVMMRVVSGLSIEETAQAIGKSAGAVKQLQRRGLAALKSLIETSVGASQ